MSAPVLVSGQEYDNEWTLEECIEYAQKNNLTIQNNRLNVQRNEVNLTQAKANYYPSFSMGGSYGYNWGRSIDPTTNLFTRMSSVENHSVCLDSVGGIMKNLLSFFIFRCC